MTTPIKHTDEVSEQDSSCCLVCCDSLTNYVWVYWNTNSVKVITVLFHWLWLSSVCWCILLYCGEFIPNKWTIVMVNVCCDQHGVVIGWGSSSISRLLYVKAYDSSCCNVIWKVNLTMANDVINEQIMPLVLLSRVSICSCNETWIIRINEGGLAQVNFNLKNIYIYFWQMLSKEWKKSIHEPSNKEMKNRKNHCAHSLVALGLKVICYFVFLFRLSKSKLKFPPPKKILQLG